MTIRRKGWLGLVLFTSILLVFFSGCESLKKKQTLTPEQEKAAQEEKEKAAREEQEKKSFEQGLAEKKYPGIEGTVWESTLLKDIHFEFDRYD
jgi:hypothetical protein